MNDSECRKVTPQKCFNWARIINDGYFRGLSFKGDPFSASIFVGDIETDQGEGIWTDQLAKTENAVHSDARFIGYAIY